MTFFFLSFSTEHEFYSCNCSLRDEAKACIFKITVFQCEGRKCCSRGRVLLCLAKQLSPCYQSSPPPPPPLPPMRSGLVVPPFHTSIEIECWNFVRHVWPSPKEALFLFVCGEVKHGPKMSYIQLGESHKNAKIPASNNSNVRQSGDKKKIIETQVQLVYFPRTFPDKTAVPRLQPEDSRDRLQHVRDKCKTIKLSSLRVVWSLKTLHVKTDAPPPSPFKMPHKDANTPHTQTAQKGRQTCFNGRKKKRKRKVAVDNKLHSRSPEDLDHYIHNWIRCWREMIANPQLEVSRQLHPVATVKEC